MGCCCSASERASLDSRHGAQLLGFLGDEPCAMIRRWLTEPRAKGHPARALAARWASHLAHDRRRSPHTVRAYVATAHRFLDFLGRHRGEEIGRSALLTSSAADLRAFLADRRASGLGRSSAAREMSAVRASSNFAAEDAGNVAAIAADPGAEAAAHPAAAGEPGRCHGLGRRGRSGAPDDWIGARDLAILLLLYGSGLRVAEALSLTARVLPLGRALRVTGKRGKTRVVPLVAGGARGDRGLCRACALIRWPGTRRCSSGRRAGRSMPTWSAARCAARGRGWACRTA